MDKEILLCRKLISSLNGNWLEGETNCNNEVKTLNPLGWCDEHLKRLPIWP